MADWNWVIVWNLFVWKLRDSHGGPPTWRNRSYITPRDSPARSICIMENHRSRAENDNRRLLRARDVIDRSPATPLDVAALASVACMSPAHFIRSFKVAFGETPHRYRQRRRLERAMRLLQETERPVTEIAMAVGWASLGSFTTTFTRVVGVPPTAFRDRVGPVPAVPGCAVTRWARPSTFGEATPLEVA